jgi:hypothetical protein
MWRDDAGWCMMKKDVEGRWVILKNMKRVDEDCGGMQKYLKLFWKMWRVDEDDDGCGGYRRMWSYSEGCGEMMKDEGVTFKDVKWWLRILKDEEGCGRMWRDVKWFLIVWRNDEGCGGMQKDVKVIWKNVEGWWRMKRDVQGCSRM